MIKPSVLEAEQAINTLLKFIGENPEREGLKDTANRVVKSYQELFAGYRHLNPEDELQKTFAETANYDQFVILKNIKFKSFCEHHLLPIVGAVDVGYIPNNKIVGISKLARIVEISARRLQLQEKMTADIAETIQKGLNPLAVGVKISATHFCMTMRGVNNSDSMMDTWYFTGELKLNQKMQKDFINRLKN